MITDELAEYLTRKGSRRDVARFRCGNEERQNRYCEAEEKRFCHICKSAPETINHLKGEWREDLVAEARLAIMGAGVSWMKVMIKARKAAEEEKYRKKNNRRRFTY